MRFPVLYHDSLFFLIIEGSVWVLNHNRFAIQYPYVTTTIHPRRLDTKKRYSKEQIIGFPQEADAGLTVKDLCRAHGFSEASY